MKNLNIEGIIEINGNELLDINGGLPLPVGWYGIGALAEELAEGVKSYGKGFIEGWITAWTE